MVKKKKTKCMLMNSLNRLRGSLAILVAAAMILSAATSVNAQVAGSSMLGVTTEEMKVVLVGWSAKKKILGKSVYNDNKQKIGTIDDLIITPDRAISYAIVGVGGFLGMGKRDVAVPVNQFKADQERIILPGATKDALKALPKFEYAK